MAVRNDIPLLVPVTSPFLKNPDPDMKNPAARTEPRSRRRSLEKVEPLKMMDGAPGNYLRRPQTDITGAKRQNRLSREVLGMDEAIVTAPDHAVHIKASDSNLTTNSSASAPSSQTQKNEGEEDANSVICGSVTSTIPDRYGFMGGVQYTQDNEKDPLPVEVLRGREIKWLQMLENWERYLSRKYRKVRDRCRKGIPSSIRPRAWQYLCGGHFLKEKNKGVFEDLLKQPGDPRWLDDIRKDLHRQFPMHEMFTDSNGPGQQELFRVLKAYSILYPEDGYFQGQAPVAAMLIMHMPAEDAFWCLVAICEKYLPGYYSQGLEAIQIDGDILVYLLKKVAPSVHRHLTKQKLDPVLYMMEWFMCIYTRTLPWSSVLRVWDIFFCEGVKVLFRVALVMLKYSLNKASVMKQCPTMYETVDVLRHLQPGITDENFLIPQILRLPINEDDMERAHSKVVEKRKAAQRNAQ